MSVFVETSADRELAVVVAAPLVGRLDDPDDE
jgi:hypothetical protein